MLDIFISWCIIYLKVKEKHIGVNNMSRSTIRSTRALKRPWTWMIYLFAALISGAAFAQPADDFEPIDSSVCADCHDVSPHNTNYRQDLEHSVHEGLECLDCHTDRGTTPHQAGSQFHPGCEGCRNCHEDASNEYQAHGNEKSKKPG